MTTGDRFTIHPASGDVVTAVLRAAADRLGAPAIDDGTGSIGFGELGPQVEAMAAQLQDLGVAPGDRVGLSIARDRRCVVAMLALMRLGAAYVPLDPDYPLDRLAMMIEDAEVGLVLVDPDATPALGSVSTASIEQVWDAADARRRAGRAAGTLPSPADLDDLAYLIFTSGSTGRPKTVQVSHRNVLAFLGGWDAVVDHRQVDRWLALTSLSFDPSVVDLLWTLSRGIGVVIGPSSTLRPTDRSVSALLRDGGVTHFQATPTRMRMLLGDPAICAELHRVRQILLGGEVVTRSLVDQIAAHTSAQVTITYGPTETTVWSTYHHVDAADADPLPIGVAQPGARIELDPIVETTGSDGWGEITIGGPYVTRGYRHRDDLTAERFFSAEGLRWYRTGDRGRFRPDGVLEFGGRVDNQVKIDGHRIEPGEIEAVLSALPAVRDAAVVPSPESDGQLRLVAFVTSFAATTDEVPPVGELRDRLAQALPAYAVPSQIVVLEAMPMTPNGKIDRVALAEAAPVVTDTSLPLPEGLTEDFRAIFGQSDLTADSDFFALGGTSLHAVRLIARVQARTGRRIPMRVLLDAPTPAQLAATLARVEAPAGAGVLVPLLAASAPAGAAGGASVPLFVVHGAGGNVLNLRPLAAGLAAQQGWDGDVIGIQAHGVDGNIAPDTSIETMAARYADALADRWPGPYRVAGHSDGGVIALEMAAQLVARGRLVDCVILIDTYLPRSVVRARPQRMWRTFLNLAGSRRRHWSARAADEVFAGAGDARDAEDAARLGYIDLQRTVETAAEAYPIGRYRTDVLLVRASRQPISQRLDYDWQRFLAGSMSTVDVDGDHNSVLAPPAVDATAAAIHGYLDARDRSHAALP